MSRVAEKLIQSAGGLPSGADVLFENVIYQFDGDGTNGDNNDTYTDSSSSPKTVTPQGDFVLQGPMSPYREFWSNYFDGSSYLDYGGDSAYDFGAGDFTIEAWFLATEASTSTDYHVISFSANSTNFWAIRIRNAVDRGLEFRWFEGSEQVAIYQGSDFTDVNSWHHVAVTRSGNSWRMFLDGTQVGSTVTNSGTINSFNDLHIADLAGLGFEFKGYISNARLVKGTAVYTSDFTPSTSPLTAITNTSFLGCQSNQFKDNSTIDQPLSSIVGSPSVSAFSPFRNTSEISMSDGGSVTRNGGADRLNISGTLPFDNQATFEAWVYTKSFTDNKLIFSSCTNNTSRNGVGISCNTSGVLAAFSFTNLTTYITSTFGITKGQWNHIALTRNGNNHRFWINGVFAGYSNANAGAMPGNLNQGSIMGWTGNHPNSGWNDTFSMTDARLSTAELYTTAFTPPTSKLTSSASTVFLLNMTDAAIHNLSAITTTQTYGDSDISTAVKKYGSGSVFIDNTSVGSFLLAGIQDIPSIGLADYTIEFWVNPDVSNASRQLLYNTTNGALIFLRSGKVWLSVGGTDRISSNATIPTGSWTHVAVCRESGSTKMYIDGIAQSTVYADTNNYTGTSIAIGANTNRTESFKGYIDDLRAVRGQAIYTENFAPPTEALPKF